jgi:hypothetical protein
MVSGGQFLLRAVKDHSTKQQDIRTTERVQYYERLSSVQRDVSNSSSSSSADLVSGVWQPVLLQENVLVFSKTDASGEVHFFSACSTTPGGDWELKLSLH